MFKTLWHKIQAYNRSSRDESFREAGKSLGVPKSTVWYHENRNKNRTAAMGTNYWNTPKGQNDLQRMIISVIYTFGIKGGAGSGRIAEHFNHLHLGEVAAISESSIQRTIKEVETNILWYKELQERGLKEKAAAQLNELEAVLGLDETWLDDMLLVCQELTSGYLFLSQQQKSGIVKAGGNL